MSTRPQESVLRAGVFGLGIMGRAIAGNLEADGLLAASWNRTPQPDFPRFRPDPADVVKAADLLFIIVTDARAVAVILDRIEPLLEARHLIIQCSTVEPAKDIEFAARAGRRGADFIEAMIAGSKDAAIARKIVFYTGGDAESIARAEPALRALSAERVHVGAIGKASAVKLATNLNLAIQIAALCESYFFARRAGLSDAEFFSVLRHNITWNRMAEFKEPKFRARDFSPQFSVKNMLKDVRLTLAVHADDYTLPLLQATERIYARAVEAGLGDEDMIALYRLLEEP
jgi:3-hydroxyisobutyrate dehydrogenase-like beta-hydroxyacid dehydrogenase